MLVKEEDGEKSIVALKKIGFEADENEHTLSKYIEGKFGFIHYPHMVLQGVSVELHVRLHEEIDSYQIPSVKVWEHSEILTLQRIEVKVPDLYDLLIYICVHLNKHFISGHVQFTSFNDVVNILDIYESKLDWKKLIDRCLEYRCMWIVFRFLLLVQKYYYAPVSEQLVQQKKIYLRKKDEDLFIKYLVGEVVTSDSVLYQFRNVYHIDGFFNKMKYFLFMLFPTKKYG